MNESANTSNIIKLEREWTENSRWKGVERPYDAAEVFRLRGSITIEHTLARMGSEKLWRLMHEDPFVNALGALTGNQAMQQVRAGLKAIYLSGWQVAADANNAGQMYPDQSLYPVSSVPEVVRRINNTLLRADQIQHAEQSGDIDWFAPIVADAEAGFGGTLNAHELMKDMIDAGAAGVHFEDQLASAKKCGHMGGKVLVPTSEAVSKLVAARLAADIADVPAVIVARTDAMGASLLTSDIDARDREFATGERTIEGFYQVRQGLEQAISRGLAYAPYADLVWCETSQPDLEQARQFSEAIRAEYPDKMLAYNCSPSFNWKKNLSEPISRVSSASWVPWATSSSSSRWPASIHSITRCSSWPGATRLARWKPTSSCRKPSLPRKRTAIPQPAISAKSVRAISTSWPRPLPPENRRLAR